MEQYEKLVEIMKQAEVNKEMFIDAMVKAYNMGIQDTINTLPTKDGPMVVIVLIALLEERLLKLKISQ